MASLRGACRVSLDRPRIDLEPLWDRVGAIFTDIRTECMVFHMKTTLIIDDRVMIRLREEAARRQKTISQLVEAALRRLLEEPNRPARMELPPLPSFHGGRSTVDDRDAFRQALEGR